MHSATRDDITKIGSKMDSKFNDILAEFKRSNEAMESWINEKFEVVESRLSEKTNILETRGTNEFSKIEVRYNWNIGLILTVGIALAGLIIKMPH